MGGLPGSRHHILARLHGLRHTSGALVSRLVQLNIGLDLHGSTSHQDMDIPMQPLIAGIA